MYGACRRNMHAQCNIYKCSENAAMIISESHQNQGEGKNLGLSIFHHYVSYEAHTGILWPNELVDIYRDLGLGVNLTEFYK